MSQKGTSDGASVPPGAAWRAWQVVLAVVLGLGLSLVLFVYVRAFTHDRLLGHFERVTANLVQATTQRIDSHMDVLYSLRDYFDTEERVSRQAFATFTRGQLARHPGIQALEWVPVVRAEARAAFEARARREGPADFRLTDRDAQNRLVSAGPRGVYFPILYVEPLAGNERALGYAPANHPRNAAIARAMDTGQPAATGRFHTVQGQADRFGVAIFVPVYRGGRTPATVAERRERLEGLVEGVLVPADMLRLSLAEAESAGIAVALTDEAAPPGERLLLGDPGPVDGQLRREVPLEMAGRDWRLSFRLVDARTLEGAQGQEWLALLIGLVATGLLGGYLSIMLNQRARVEAMVVERTRALAQEQELARNYLEEVAVRRAELQQAQEIDRLKSNFVSAVSHDLRTPLTSIMGYAEFLEDEIGGALSNDQKSYVGQILRGARRLEHLVDDLLDFARLDAGTFQLRREPADLGRQMLEVAQSLMPQVEEAGQQLKLEVAEGPLEAPVDTLRLDRVLVNLLHNAIKFTPVGGTVTLRVTREGDHLRCEVEDTGIGIPEDQIPKLFQRFSQLKSGSEKGGTGLGLSICKAIIDAHGGAIGVRSAQGQGSVFWFTLPAA